MINMKLENMLNIIDELKSQETIEKSAFDLKLEQLKKYQEQTMLRAIKVYNELFKDIESLIIKFAHEKPICCEHNGHKMFIWFKDGCITVKLDNYKRFTISESEYYSKIEDWWSNKPYREYILERTNLLNRYNCIMSFIEDNIEVIYDSIAKRVKDVQVENQKKTNDILQQLNFSSEVNKKINKVVKITIEIIE